MTGKTLVSERVIQSINQIMNAQNSAESPAETSRRDFLKKTSTAVVGGTLLGGLSVERAAHAAGSDCLNIALIGCGGRGSGAADQALSTTGNTKLVAMADAFPDRLDDSLKNLKKQHSEKVQVADDKKFVGFDAYK